MENVERRLELIKMLRSEHEENIGRIRKREHILYPNRKLSYSDSYEKRAVLQKTSLFSDQMYENKNADQTSQSKDNYGFYMRLAICMGLFLGFIYMETQNVTFCGISHNQIQQAVCETIDMNSFAFMEQFTYTLEE